jgi:hypothetical protein
MVFLSVICTCKVIAKEGVSKPRKFMLFTASSCWLLFLLASAGVQSFRGSLVGTILAVLLSSTEAEHFMQTYKMKIVF